MVRTWRLVTVAADSRGGQCSEPQAGAPPQSPTQKGPQTLPPPLGKTGQALTFPSGLRGLERGVLGGQAAGRDRGTVNPEVLAGSSAPWEEKQPGRPRARGERSQQIEEKSQLGVHGKE